MESEELDKDGVESGERTEAGNELEDGMGSEMGEPELGDGVGELDRAEGDSGAIEA